MGTNERIVVMAHCGALQGTTSPLPPPWTAEQQKVRRGRPKGAPGNNGSGKARAGIRVVLITRGEEALEALHDPDDSMVLQPPESAQQRLNELLWELELTEEGLREILELSPHGRSPEDYLERLCNLVDQDPDEEELETLFGMGAPELLMELRCDAGLSPEGPRW